MLGQVERQQRPHAVIAEPLPHLGGEQPRELARMADRAPVEVAGMVIVRQRPETARGIVFVSLEDETGIANVIVLPHLFESHRLVVTQEPALRITGKLQNLHGVIHVKADTITALTASEVPAQASHDFR
jgi:error-prone DNA polymerase